MTVTIPTPRLLPATITIMAALLLLKCGILTQAAVTHGPKPDGIMVASANAASTEATTDHGKSATPSPHEKSPSSSPHGKPVPAAEATPTAAPTVPVVEGPPPVSESEKALLLDLRKRRQELEARADAMSTRESVLVATEQKLSSRVTELQSLQAKLEHLDASQKQKEDAGWQGLVKLYESMKAKEAAAIFNDLSMPVLLQVLDRMKDAKAAAVMAAMNPDKARDVTAELAELRTGQNMATTNQIKFNRSGG